jgi:hypothetical protein
LKGTKLLLTSHIDGVSSDLEITLMLKKECQWSSGGLGGHHVDME